MGKATTSRTRLLSATVTPSLYQSPLADTSALRRSRRVRVPTSRGDDRNTTNITDIEDLVLSSRSKLTTSRVHSEAVSKKKAARSAGHLTVPHPAPAQWQEVYSMIVEMRSREVAPVDTMGCQLAQMGETDPVAKRVSTLISLMCSSQTTDTVCDSAIKKLRAAVGGSITVAALIEADEETIRNAINKVGFWRKKASYIKIVAQVLHDNHNSDVPKTVEDLCALMGVGPKMAFLTLCMAWKINIGVGVDVHVDRITNRLGWHTPSTLGHAEKTRMNLESWLPQELWYDINHKLVGFGQTICTPVSPRCHLCDLSSAGLCPSANSSSNNSRKEQRAEGSTARSKVKID